ncbi:carbohydrate ABC transporter permease [Occultella aeris]|uniref:L-arabinose transport system permease protein AraQ n=1 Tax=Occultella aeris TaxID=2761496 RepID=A0A7M4DGV4_9MICO|nr:carbohydrate ABC transporter permease [Occultella aeris]VZO36147.1 L-arabinose transport system permease protein AraQ [Occultella aeris]
MSVIAQSGLSERKIRRRDRLVNGNRRPGVAMLALKGVVLSIACALVIIPFVGIVSTSISSPAHVLDSGGFVLFPDTVNLTAYRSILGGGVVTQALLISGFVTVVGTLCSLTVTSLLGYSLSRPETFGGKPMLMALLVSMLFSPGLIPLYLVVKGMGMIDSLAALIVPTMISAFNVIVIRAFFSNLPQELIDAAKVDGAGELQTFTRIVLPLSKAVLAVIGLFYAVNYWNAFFNALIYLNDAAKWPVQLVLRTYVINNAQLDSGDLGGLESMPPQPSIQMAILVITLIPIICVYPFLQKHFAKGVLTGAVKG